MNVEFGIEYILEFHVNDVNELFLNTSIPMEVILSGMVIVCIVLYENTPSESVLKFVGNINADN
jgi:hypothetical protein